MRLTAAQFGGTENVRGNGINMISKDEETAKQYDERYGAEGLLGSQPFGRML